jgi:hypothetical protein
MKYNVWNKWGKLKTVMLGTCHPPEFYDVIKSDKIRDPLLRITEETLEDLDYYESVLKDFGCKVLRPPTQYNLDAWDNINNNDNQVKPIPRGSLQPRDFQLVMGDKFVVSSLNNPLNNKGIVDTVKKYNSKDLLIDPNAIKKIIGNQTTDQVWPAACVTVVGDRVYYDALEVPEKSVQWLKKTFPHFKYIKLELGGHNDGYFHTLKPGLLISTEEVKNYDETFPGWEVCYLPDSSWDNVKEWHVYKNKTDGKWYLPGESDNDEFITFVNSWLNDWVGYVEETVFDVNVLVLDEHHVCVSNNKNETVNNFFKKHKMEPVYIPWRHGHFWDGGVHCITLDLEREGNMEDYF